MERMDKSNKELADDPFLLASWIAKSLAGNFEMLNLNILWLLIKLPVGRGTRED